MDITVVKKKVEYFIEVKWGAIKGCSVSDSDIKTIIKGSEKEKMKRNRWKKRCIIWENQMILIH